MIELLHERSALRSSGLGEQEPDRGSDCGTQGAQDPLILIQEYTLNHNVKAPVI